MAKDLENEARHRALSRIREARTQQPQGGRGAAEQRARRRALFLKALHHSEQISQARVQ